MALFKKLFNTRDRRRALLSGLAAYGALSVVVDLLILLILMYYTTNWVIS